MSSSPEGQYLLYDLELFIIMHSQSLYSLLLYDMTEVSIFLGKEFGDPEVIYASTISCKISTQIMESASSAELNLK